MRAATWNIKSLNNRDQETMNELSDNKIDICAIQETKKKGNGQKLYPEYLSVYSGVPKNDRAREGVAIAIKKKYIGCIEECWYISSRIVVIRMNTEKQKLNILSIYAPEDNRPKAERELFYDELQDTIYKLPPRQPMIILGDFNARVGNEVIPGVKQRFNEAAVNNNGELMMGLCSFNELRINNTFYGHKPQ